MLRIYKLFHYLISKKFDKIFTKVFIFKFDEKNKNKREKNLLWLMKLYKLSNEKSRESKSISWNFLACRIEGKRRTRSVVRFRMWIRSVPLRQSRAAKFQSFSFVPEFNQPKKEEEPTNRTVNSSVKLFQNQIVDSYGNTQDVKISRKLNSKSFHPPLHWRGFTIDEWTRGVWSLV